VTGVQTCALPICALSYNNAAITWTGMGTGQLIGSVGSTQVVIVSIADDGLFSVELLQPIDHPDGNLENVAAITIPVTVSDSTAFDPCGRRMARWVDSAKTPGCP